MKTYSNLDLTAALEKAGVYVLSSYKDGTYVLPTSKFVNGVFREAFRKYLEQLGFDQKMMLEWEEELADCDDFADFARSHMRMCHIKSWVEAPKTIPKAAIAFATVCISDYSGNGVGHAINAYFTLDEKDELTVKFWEPQRQWDVVLTARQLNNVFSVEL